MKSSAVIIAAAVLAAPFHAQAAPCRLGQLSATGVSLRYDAFESSAASTPIAIQMQTSGDCRQARVEFALAPTPSNPQTGSHVQLRGAGGAALAAEITDAGGQIRSVTAAGATAFTGNQISYPLGATGVLSSGPSLTLTVQPGDPVPPGPYAAQLLLLAQVNDLDGGSFSTSTPLVMNVQVTPSVRLAAGSSDLNIEFGELAPGATPEPVRFDAYANLDYELRLVSEHNFALAAPGISATAPYQPYISDQPVSEAAQGDGRNGRRIVFAAPGGAGRRAHTLKVKLLDFHQLPASNNYSDLLTIEVHARV